MTHGDFTGGYPNVLNSRIVIICGVLRMKSDLCTLKVGESAFIDAIMADPALSHRLAALGFRVGKAVTLVRLGRFRGPMQIRVGTTDVVLRRSDASKIRIKPAA